MPFLVGDNMKKIKYLLLLFILIPFRIVFADSIDKITMDIYVNENGVAEVTEKWSVKADSGSEWYRSFIDMNNQEVSDFEVFMDNKEYQYKEWNINESLSEKAGYFGINNIDNGFELCFGKTDFNNHIFTLKYKISNYVYDIDDEQIINEKIWSDISIDNFQITLRSFYDFSDDLDVWGFGYQGYAYVEDGVIKASNEEGHYVDGEDVVLLVRFKEKVFNTNNNPFPNAETFDEALEIAEEGSSKWNDSNKNRIGEIISMIFGFLFSFGIPLIIIIIAAMNATSGYGTKRIKFTKGAKDVKNAPYFRDIPFKNDIFKPYWIACQYGLVKNKTDFLGAVLLKWLKNGNVENTTVTTKVLKKEERAIKLIHNDKLSELEMELYDMMMKASEDGILESNEFTRWCKKNYNKILKWFNKVIDQTTIDFTNENKITCENKTFGAVYTVDDRLKEDALKVAGVKNFLNDFSNISERESIEVKLWEEYLIYAQIFGIAKKVAKEFKKLYPDVITDELYNDVIFIHTISYQGVSAASSARSAAESYSAGGGGFSSLGGGGGSIGGGSFGGR